MGATTVRQLTTWAELDALPVGAIVRDVEGDEYTRQRGGQFEGVGGLSFSAVGLRVYAPVTLLNPEILLPGRFREGDRVEVVSQVYWPLIRPGETGEVYGLQPAADGWLIGVRLDDGTHVPFTNCEITPA